MRYNGNTNLHHVQIKAVRRILGCKSGLCVVHVVTGGVGEGNGGRGVKEREEQQEKEMSEEKDMRDEVEEREGRGGKERSVAELVDG